MDPELNRYTLMNEAKGLVSGYPQSMLDMLGECNIAAIHGSTHKNMRGSLLALVSPTMIIDQLLPKIDEFMRSHQSNWDNKVIDIQEKTKKIAFFLSLDSLFRPPYISLSALKLKEVGLVFALVFAHKRFEVVVLLCVVGMDLGKHGFVIGLLCVLQGAVALGWVTCRGG
ncbi:unnamed protein product [Ilex paraguariensis]|uniref:Uncharacterized protein n=1 Tax=Ilex paraguariensis TaxID=185542 RepID=A0ABC8RK33_9AQUA